MYVKGENMDDEKEFYRSEIIRYVKKCNNTDWLYVTYYLLKKSTVPTIIVECGFLSNQAEADKLVTGAYQERLAFYIAMAVMQYVSGMQKAPSA